MHMAIYRAYRPAYFRDVIGQDHITTALRNEVRDGRLAHAYLFTGSRGTGKTTCAKILTKAVNCLSPVDGEPCGECEICRGIEDGSILDVIEIDAASNNGVDYVRALREEAYYTPVKAKYRVYIIDEVHMLSIPAFNALLKIMEEPPAHVIFILATTEVHKILATILSRCQRFDFMRVSESDIADRIEKIAEEENFTITREAALLLGRLGDGAVRDALSILDKCLSVSRQLTEDQVLAITGVTDGTLLMDLADAVISGSYEKVLQLTKMFYDHSKDFSVLCSQMISLYRDILMAKLNIDQPPLSRGIPKDRFVAAAAGIDESGIVASLQALCKCRDEMGRILDARMQLEITLAQLTLGVTAQPTVVQAPVQKKKEIKAAPTPAVQEVAAAPQPDVQAPPVPAEGRFEQWNEVLAALQKINSALWSTLVGSKAYLSAGRVLIDTDNPLFFDMIKSNQNSKSYIRKALLEVTGHSFGLGPYKRETKPEENTKLQELLKRADEAGIPVEIED